MKKWMIGSLILITVIAIYLTFNYDKFQLEKKGAYQYVNEGDKDDIYERIVLVKKVQGERELSKLLFALLDNKNGYMWSNHLAISYVGINNMKEFLPSLKLIRKDFETRNDLPKNAYIRELLENAITGLNK